MKSLKTPLRWPGGKSRATKFLLPKFPKNIKEYIEPFLGGGSVAIAFSKENPSVSIWVNDMYEPLINFWVYLQKEAQELSDCLIDIKNEYDTPEKAKKLFLESKERINDEHTHNLERAIAFYIVNKCSFSGLTEGSSFSAQASVNNFSMNGIKKLPLYQSIIKDWKITCSPYWNIVSNNIESETFWFFDPPYDIKDNLYGKNGNMHKTFNHHAFYLWVSNVHYDNWMITYNTNEELVKWYNEYYQEQWDLAYSMISTGEYRNKQKNRKELLILNYDKPISK